MDNMHKLYNTKDVHKEFHPQRLVQLLAKSSLSANTLEIEKGTKMIEENHLADKVYFVMKGVVGIEKESEIYAYLPQGNFLGLENMVSSEPPFFTFYACTKLEVRVFLREEVRQYLGYLQEGWLFLYAQVQTMRDYIRDCRLIKREKGDRKIFLTLALMKEIFPDELLEEVKFNYREISRFAGVKEDTVRKILREHPYLQTESLERGEKGAN
ncbi:cyclic nucleotide-binding domain-containing protein [Listeria ilorinensis]|uniref:cyclic nucleotide-binding domain-containing protein n=1 Tax=Listeria ilorinensis TaxID=2867439 RepID=UPI001EF473C1|nr:cyclic nucleotide-binding domain-containing protein [Listeria ilorinensis]